METSQRVANHFGERYVEISYERLSEDPIAATTELFRFCGLDHGEEVVRKAVEAHDFAANYAGGGDQFRRGGRTGDWRTTFSLTDRLAFERAAGGMLRARGYEHSRWWWLRPSRRTRAGDRDKGV